MKNDKFFSSLESMIEIEGSDNRLKRIGEYIWILMPLRIELSTRDLYSMKKNEADVQSQLDSAHEQEQNEYQ